MAVPRSSQVPPASEPELDRGLWLKREGVVGFLGKGRPRDTSTPDCQPVPGNSQWVSGTTLVTLFPCPS